MQKTILFILCILSLTQMATCQTKDISLIGGGGLSFLGTGDMKGYSFFNQVDIQLNKHFYLSPGIQFNNNSQTYLLYDFKLNYVTTGMNVFTNINYFVLNASRHRISIGAGPVLRFQSSSYPREVWANLESTGERSLFISYDKLHSTSLGYNVAPSYYYQCTKRFFLGAKFIFQNDTEGDVITSGLLFAGIKL